MNATDLNTTSTVIGIPSLTELREIQLTVVSNGFMEKTATRFADVTVQAEATIMLDAAIAKNICG